MLDTLLSAQLLGYNHAQKKITMVVKYVNGQFPPKISYYKITVCINLEMYCKQNDNIYAINIKLLYLFSNITQCRYSDFETKLLQHYI